MMGLVPTCRGEVRLFGTPLERFRDWQRVGFVPQRVSAASGVPGLRARGGRLRPAVAAPAVRAAAPRGPDARRGRDRRGRAGRQGPRRRLHAVRRPAAAGADRPGPGRRARPAGPRRADRRRRRAEPAGRSPTRCAPSSTAAPRSCWSPTSSARSAPLVDRARGDARRPDRVRRTADRRVHRRGPVATTTTTTRRRGGRRPRGRRSPRRSTRPGRSDPMSLLTYDFMVRALLGALFTGLAAPAVGTYLVQRRLALMGDGIGHIAVTGVALGLLTGTSPTVTAVVVAVIGAVVIEVIREQRPHQRRRRPGAAVLRRHRRRRADHRPRRAERGDPEHATCSARSPRSRRPTSWVTVVLAAGRRGGRGRAVPAAVRGRPGRGVRAGRRAQRAGLQPAGLGDGRGHGHRRDAHRRPAAGQRADGRAGGDLAAGRPGRSGPRWSPRWALGMLASVGGRRGARPTLDVAPGATIVLLALAGFAAAYPVGVLAAPAAAAGRAVRRAGRRVPAASRPHRRTRGPRARARRRTAATRPCRTATTSTTSTTATGTPPTESHYDEH